MKTYQELERENADLQRLLEKTKQQLTKALEAVAALHAASHKAAA